MLRVTAYVLRFINNLKRCSKKSNTNLSTFITKHERNLAAHLWLIYIEKDVFTEKQYEHLKYDLRFIVIHGVIKCKGRLSNNSVSFNTKHAIFLSKCYFTKFVTLYYHQIVLHNRVKETFNEIRTKFWIPKARNFTQQIVRSCSTCKKYDTRSYIYPKNQTDLPNSRVSCEPHFTFPSIDYTGPLYAQNIYEGSETYKACILLFTCSSTHSICLESVPSYNASVSIKTGLRQCFSRRGTPTFIFSDDSSNFTTDVTQQYASSRNITWNFNPVASPWLSGIYERIVRSVKRYLKKILEKNTVTYKELETILYEIEIILNN